MNKNKLVKIILLVLSVMIAFAFTSCARVMKYVKEYVNTEADVSVISFVNATEEDFQRYNNAFPLGKPELDRDNYRLVKLNCEIKNNSPFAISFSKLQPINNDDFYLSDDAADYEPTFCIRENKSMLVDIYIYVNNELTDENELRDKLDKLKIKLLAYKVDG